LFLCFFILNNLIHSIFAEFDPEGDENTPPTIIKPHRSAEDVTTDQTAKPSSSTTVAAKKDNNKKATVVSQRSTMTRAPSRRRRRKDRARMGVTLDALDLPALDSAMAAADEHNDQLLQQQQQQQQQQQHEQQQQQQHTTNDGERRRVGRAATTFGGHVLCRICEQRVASFALAVSKQPWYGNILNSLLIRHTPLIVPKRNVCEQPRAHPLKSVTTHRIINKQSSHNTTNAHNQIS
jgi:hypothetical protein